MVGWSGDMSQGVLLQNKSGSGTMSVTRDGNRNEGRAPPVQGAWGALEAVREVTMMFEVQQGPHQHLQQHYKGSQALPERLEGHSGQFSPQEMKNKLY